MRTLLACATLMLLPLSALANDAPCKFTDNRDLKLELAGAKTVVLEVNQHDLHVVAGSGPARRGRGAGTKCRQCRPQQRVRQDLLAWDVPLSEPVWRPIPAPRQESPWRAVPAWAMAAAGASARVAAAAAVNRR